MLTIFFCNRVLVQLIVCRQLNAADPSQFQILGYSCLLTLHRLFRLESITVKGASHCSQQIDANVDIQCLASKSTL